MLKFDYTLSHYQTIYDHFVSYLNEEETQLTLSDLSLNTEMVINEIESAHQIVLTKLLNSLLREQFYQLKNETLCLCNENIPLYHLIAPQWDDHGLLLRLEGINHTADHQAVSCITLFQRITSGFEQEKCDEVISDLMQTWFLTALANAYRKVWATQTLASSDNLWQHLSSVKSPYDSYVFLEQFSAVGHPSHPTDRSKPGLTLSEVIALSPDFNAQVPLVLGALRDTHISKNSFSQQEAISTRDIRLYWQEYYPDEMLLWERRLNEENENPAHFVPMPIHPWHGRFVLPELFSRDIINGNLYLFNEITIKTKPSLSFRSMLSEHGPCIKVPMGIKMTSAKRLLSARSVHMGPRFTRFLSNLLSQSPTIAKYISCQVEDVGVHYHQENVEDETLFSYLSYVCRRNICDGIDKNHVLMPAASLMIKDHHQTPLWLSTLQATGDNRIDAALRFFNQYCDVMIKGAIALYLKTGIGLEVHQQNTVLVLNQSAQVVHAIIRDFGAFRAYMPKLNQLNVPLVFHHDNRLQTDDPKLARNRIVHALFISQFGELIKSMSDHYKVPEKTFWHALKQQLLQFKAQPHDDPQWVNSEIDAFINEPWQMKALLRMRLCPKGEYVYTHIVNPMANA